MEDYLGGLFVLEVGGKKMSKDEFVKLVELIVRETAEKSFEVSQSWHKNGFGNFPAKDFVEAVVNNLKN